MYDDYNYADYGVGQLSIRAYNIVIGLVLMWGFVVNILMCIFCTDIFLSWNFTYVVIGYFVVAVIGIFISNASNNAFISFIGYNLVVVPVGVVLSIGLADYNVVSIMNALRVTAGLTCVMIILACVYPDFFLSMGRVLLVTLVTVVAFEILLSLLGLQTTSLWDIGVALIFCLYIGYDWAKAQEKSPTLDNAVDSVVDLYLDIVNLFVRILASSSKSNSND